MAPPSIGELIREHRKVRRISQTALAKASGLPQPTLSRIETGRRNPSVAQLRALARVLEVPVSSLIPPTETA